jgi:signal peptidase II
VRGPVVRAWALAGALCALVVVLDQIAKAVVRDRIVIGEHVDVLGPLRLTLTHNRGVAFGLAGGAGIRLIVFTVIALAVIGFVFSRNPTRPGMWIAVGLISGGALGNMIDRIRADAVTDFIDLPPWPPFNLADVAITFGVILLVCLYLWDAERERRNGPDEEAQGG